MKKQLIIIGAGGHGKVCADIAEKMNNWSTIVFMDNDLDKNIGYKIIGTTSEINKHVKDSDFFIAVGNNLTRKKIFSQLDNNANITTLIHPNAVLGKNILVGKGTVIMAGVVINCDTEIGMGCIINTTASVDHDNIIENFVHLSPGVNLAGTVKVGENSWLGIGSTVINNITITSNCIIGAGGVVTKDIALQGVYVGIPVNKKK